LLDNVRDIVQLSKLMPVMIFEHAFGTNELMAVSAEVLNLTLLMHVTVDARVVSYFCVCRLGWHDHVLRSDRAELHPVTFHLLLLN
jgi:hypothetical protein